MKKLKFESTASLILFILSLVLSIYTSNGLYLFFGVLYSIIIFLIFFVARKKYGNFSKKQLVIFSLISLLVIIALTLLMIVLFFAGMQSFMKALGDIG